MQCFCICSSADSNQYLFCFKGLHLAANLYIDLCTDCRRFYRLHLCICHNLYALCLHQLLQLCCQLAIHHGQQLRCGFYHRYLCTEFGVRSCQFDTDYTAANDQKAFGNFFKRQSACRIYAVCIFLYPGNGRHRRDGACCDDDFIKCHIFLCTVLFQNSQSILGCEGCCSLHNLNLICLHQTGNTAYQLCGNGIFLCLHLFPVYIFHFNIDAVFRHFLCFCQRLCRMQDCLCGNTADIQAGAAELILFNQRYLAA